MASDVTGGKPLRALGVPYDLTPDHLWAAKATYSQQGPEVGEAEAQGSYTLQLQTAGSQSASKQLRLRVQRPGHPGPEGASVVYRYEGETPYRGRDIQTTSGYQTIRTTADSNVTSVADPDSASFYDEAGLDKIATAYQLRWHTGSSPYRVECAVYSPSTNAWTTAIIYSQAAAPTDGYHPAIAYNEEDGYLYVAHWIYDDTANLAQVRVHRSRDGATWTTISDYALDVGVDISGTVGGGAAGYEVGRLRMGFAGGQCLLVGHVIANDTDGSPAVRDQIAQFASTSRAARFTTVEIAMVPLETGGTASFGYHSVAVINSRLHVCWAGVPTALASSSFLLVVDLPSAFYKVSTRASVFLSTGTMFNTYDGASAASVVEGFTSYRTTKGDGSFWVAEDGTVYAALRFTKSGTASEGGVFLVQSTDDTTTFKYCGDGDSQGTTGAGALVIYSGDSSTYIEDFVGCSHRGRQVIVGLSLTDVTAVRTLSAVFLGGPTSVNTPGRIKYPSTFQRSGWSASYLPLELPANLAGITTAGSGTDSIGSDGLLSRVTSSATKHSSWAPTSTIAQGLIVRYAVEATSGGSVTAERAILKVRCGDGSDLYEVTIRLGTSSFRMQDDKAGSQVGSDQTIDVTAGIDLLVAVTGGSFSCWYRALSTASDRAWSTGIEGHSLTSSGTGSNLIQWGTVLSGTVTQKIHEVHYLAGAATLSALGGGFSNPGDLFGIDLARRGRYSGIDDGVQVTGIDGSGQQGDSFNVDTVYGHPIERIFHGSSPSPRSTWRSVAVGSGSVAEQLIPFVLNTDATSIGTEEQGLGGTFYYLHCSGVNWQTGTVERWDVGTSSWVSVATIDNAITTGFSATRRGSEVICSPALSGPVTVGRYLYEDECAGWTMKIGSDYRKITGNSAGTLADSAPGPTPVFWLEGVTGSEPTSSAISLIPDSFTTVFHTHGETGGGWALRIASQATKDKYVTIGALSMGRVFVFGTQYSRGRVLVFDSGDITQDSPSGVRRGRRAGPGGRLVRLAWTDPVDTTQLQSDAADPDYLKSTSTVGNLANAAQKDIPFSLLGLIRRVGAITPVVYLPQIPISTGGGDTRTFNRAEDHLYAQITSSAQAESVVGNEAAAEALRVSTVVLEEVR